MRRHKDRKVHCSPTHNSHDMEKTIMSIDREGTRNMEDANTREGYSAIKKNENMPFAATWMDPEVNYTK